MATTEETKAYRAKIERIKSEIASSHRAAQGLMDDAQVMQLGLDLTIAQWEETHPEETEGF